MSSPRNQHLRTLSPAGSRPWSRGVLASGLLALATCGPSNHAERVDVPVGRSDAASDSGPGADGNPGGDALAGEDGMLPPGPPEDAAAEDTPGAGGGDATGMGGSAGDAGPGDVVAPPADLAPPRPDVPPPPPSATRGLVGHWRFDEGMGNVVLDTSPTQNHGGTINILDGDWKPGKRGTALLFTAARRTFVQIPDHGSLSSAAGLSVGLWVNAAGWTGTPCLLQKGELDEQYGLRAEAGQLRFSVRVAGGLVARVTAAAPALNKWVHVVGTHDGHEARLYVDGNQVASIAAAGATASGTGNITIGGRGGAALAPEFFSGLLDDALIYDRALSVEEIKLLLPAKLP